MISRILIVILLLFTIGGCGVKHTATPPPGLNLNFFRSNMEYNQIVQLLTKECDIKFPGFFKEVNISALLVHNSLKTYLPNIPEDKTRIDFYLRGREEYFNIEKIMFTVKTDNGIDYKIVGIGSNNVVVNGVKNDNLIGYVVNSSRGGPSANLLSEFSLILPFELTNKLGSLRVNLQSNISENICELKWQFSK